MPLDQIAYVSGGHQAILSIAKTLKAGDFPFHWDYMRCDHCAIMVGRLIFGDAAWRRDFDLTREEYEKIFIYAGKHLGIKVREVQPKHIVGIIENTVAEGLCV